MNHLPKIELHLHLDCSLSFEVVSVLRPGITLEEFERDFIAPKKCKNLAEYLTCPPQAVQLMQSKRALRLVTLDLFQQLRRDNVIYAEVRFAPLLHVEGGLSPEEIVAAVDAATAEAVAETGIEAGIILCTLRHYSREQSLVTAKLVQQFRGRRVVALDLAGDEAGFPLDAHIPAFQYAIDHDLPRTSHAGEACGPESVWNTLRYLHPNRIGHGVRSTEDPALVEHLKRSHIHLEVCPTSNVQTNVTESYATHPVSELYAAGVSLGINTDARTVSNVSLSEEYAKLQQQFGWTKEHLLNCNLQALDAAFAKEAVKGILRERLVSEYQVSEYPV